MKNIIKTCTICIFLFLFTNASSQELPLTFGVKAGVNLSNMYGDTNDADPLVGFQVGVSVEYLLPQNMFLLSGLELTRKGGKDSAKLNVTDGDGNLLRLEVEEKLTPMYIQIPLHVGYKMFVSNSVKMVFHAGPYLAYGISGKYKNKMKVNGYEFTDDDFINELGIKKDGNVFSSNGLKEFDFGLGIAAGAEFGQIVTKIGYDFGLTNSSDVEDYKLRTRNAYLTLGYNF